MKTKCMLLAVVSLIFLSISRLNVRGSIDVVMRKQLPYEVLKIDVQENSLYLNGWAFISDNQHFLDNSTHSIDLEFISLDHSFKTQANLTNHDMTHLMHYRGARICGAKEFFKVSSECNYIYQYVGFETSIDLDKFKTDEKYHVMIVVHAKQSQTSYKSQLYYPLDKPLITTHNDHLFKVVSNIKDTRLTINYHNVVVRNGPSMIHPVYQMGTNCSTTYGNQLFYRFGSVFDHIFEKHIYDRVTYYRMKGSVDLCFDQRKRIKQGNEIDPVWIASTFVEYSGTMLTVQKELVNSAPVLYIDHPTITINEYFDPFDHVEAYDEEEGNLIHKVTIVSNKYKNQVGVYPIMFRVEDKHGYSDQQIMYVTVIEDNKLPPIIVASDRKIRKGSVYVPLQNVYAYDGFNVDLTDRLIVLNELDTSKTGLYDQCFSVTDDFYVTTIKCVKVEIYDFDVRSWFRFVANDIPFVYSDNWRGFQNRLAIELSNLIPQKSKIMTQHVR